MKIVHILNGDMLFQQFPDLPGEKIVLRECLIEGNTSGETWEQFIQNRQVHIKTTYEESVQAYLEKSVAEFDKIKHISKGSNVYFWFEDDLFCQVNFWFACSLLADSTAINCYFVRAKPTNEYGFGGMNEVELTKSFENPTPIQVPDFKLFVKFWELYQANEIQSLVALKTNLSTSFKFVGNAIDAAAKMKVVDGEKLSYYEQLLLDIMQSQSSPNFQSSFLTFSKQASILGLGDLQVKRMYDKLLPHV